MYERHTNALVGVKCLADECEMRGGYQICNFPMGEFHPKKGYFLGSPKFRQSEGAHTPGAYPQKCGSLPLMACVWAFGVMVE